MIKTTMLKSAFFSFIITGSGAVSLSGCSSVMTHTGAEQGYYPGTRASMDVLRDEDTSWAMMPLVAIDLPFSAVADTLLLPYDYYRSRSGNTSIRERVLHSEQNNQTANSQAVVPTPNQNHL
ncbi:YceK/YidQ family lipoprotein [Brenneria rubrifaciens]|uniref:YceK/YidQ family lipoprotein n=2 Tax=Brenneria rubrifaciens TaxID=55213 RepID=A0A4P8R3D4_9GAMM|nr:YceK/YidQ family lipoprotein [Brenneria rubrifaciens]